MEVDLAAQFGVAPMTVREALATLRDQGLVETRRAAAAVRSWSGLRRAAGRAADRATG